MAFQVPNTLLVTVYGANNLSPRDTNGSADPFVKIAIPGCDKVFQTQVCLSPSHSCMGIHYSKLFGAAKSMFKS